MAALPFQAHANNGTCSLDFVNDDKDYGFFEKYVSFFLQKCVDNVIFEKWFLKLCSPYKQS